MAVGGGWEERDPPHEVFPVFILYWANSTSSDLFQFCQIAPEGAVHGSLAQCPPGGLGHAWRLRLTPGPTLPLWMSLTCSLYPASPPSPARARIRAHCSKAGAPSPNWPGDSSPPFPPPLVCLTWHHILADIPAPILLWPGHAVPWPVRLPSTSRSKTCDLHDPYFA